MKRIKIFVFFCLIFILTGCSVEYNLTINEDDTISEKVVASENTNRMESSTRLKGKQAVNYLFNMFKRDNENITISSKETGNITYATATNSLKNLDEYSQKFTSDVFKTVDIEKKDGIITIVFNQSEKLGGDSSKELIYDDIKVNISIPYKVLENNADVVKGNTYTWNIKKDGKLKNIKISYDDKSKYDSINLKINDKTYNINYGLLVIGVIILSILIIIFIVYFKNKKNNVV